MSEQREPPYSSSDGSTQKEAPSSEDSTGNSPERNEPSRRKQEGIGIEHRLRRIEAMVETLFHAVAAERARSSREEESITYSMALQRLYDRMENFYNRPDERKRNSSDPLPTQPMKIGNGGTGSGKMDRAHQKTGEGAGMSTDNVDTRAEPRTDPSASSETGPVDDGDNRRLRTLKSQILEVVNDLGESIGDSLRKGSKTEVGGAVPKDRDRRGGNRGSGLSDDSPPSEKESTDPETLWPVLEEKNF